ncbi:MAG: amino acid adenylation domain-containing protein [Symploca sp. SIO1A3]|nr:amino acid adenylation domain-containing protein [Symploca sp. SIO1A3]
MIKAQYSCIHNLFEEQVKKRPQATAVIFQSQELTYSELNRRSNQVAHYLQNKGVKPDDIIGIFLDRSLEMLVGILGILKSGAAYLPMDTILPKERLVFMLEDTQVLLILTNRELLKYLPNSNYDRDIIFLNEWNTFVDESEENPISDVTSENLAYIIYTSGSTGRPKGVMIQHCGVDNMVQAQVKFFNVRPESRILQFYSFAFDASVFETFMALLTGATLIIETRDILMQGPPLADLLREKKITSIQFPPSVLELLPSKNLPDLEIVMVGGEVYPPDLVNRWSVGHRLFNVYGPTESTVWTAVYERIDERPKLPIGKPIPNMQIYILDENLQKVPVSEPGEICIGGVGLARGYLNRPKLTEEKFIANPFSEEPGTRLYKTGDLGRYLPDGNIEFLGRMDHQVKIRGFRIELGEIEWVLQSHSAIKEAVVVVREHKSGDKQLVAYLVLKQEEINAKEIRSLLKTKLPNYMVPSAFVTLDSLPRTPNDKVDRNALLDPDNYHLEYAAKAEKSEMPRTPLEQEIAEIWRQIIGVEQIGIQDNFFDLGGHSLLATKIIMRLREDLKIELPLSCLFESPTVESFAKCIETMSTQGSSSLLSETPDFDHDAELADDLYINYKTTYTFTRPQQIFLTGATGFLGKFLLSELLKKTEAEIYCLVRASHPQEGKEKIQKSLSKCSLWNQKENQRIKPVLGDLSQPFLGLSGKQFNSLADKIDAIYHNGAWVNYIEPYFRLKPTNVLGTQEVIRLAFKGKLKLLHHISSSSVFGAVCHFKGIKKIREDDDINLSLGHIFGGYIQSKWVAEKMIWNAQARGLPVTVYRCARIMGHSQTGVSNPNDFLSLLIKNCIELGSFYDLKNKCDDLITVDFASQAIVHLSLKKESIGKPFHIVNSHPIDYSDFWNFVIAYGYRLNNLNYEDWLQKNIEYFNNNTAHSMYALLPLLLDKEPKSQRRIVELFHDMPYYDNRNVLEGIDDSSIAIPKLKKELVATWLNYLVESGFLPTPQSQLIPVS